MSTTFKSLDLKPRSPRYLELSELLDFFSEETSLCEEHMEYLRRCDSLEEVYDCQDAEFWRKAVSYDINMLTATPLELRAQWDAYDWKGLIRIYPSLITYVPTDCIGSWNAQDWRLNIQYQPVLSACVPAVLENIVGKA